MGTVAYRPLTTAETIFKDLVWNPMISLGEVWIEGSVPFLALPVIKQIDETLIEALTNALFNQFVMLVDVTAIRLVNSAHQATYDYQSEQLAVIIDEKGESSDEYKKARDSALQALSQFTHIGPS